MTRFEHDFFDLGLNLPLGFDAWAFGRLKSANLKLQILEVSGGPAGEDAYPAESKRGRLHLTVCIHEHVRVRVMYI